MNSDNYQALGGAESTDFEGLYQAYSAWGGASFLGH